MTATQTSLPTSRAAAATTQLLTRAVRSDEDRGGTNASCSLSLAELTLPPFWDWIGISCDI